MSDLPPRGGPLSRTVSGTLLLAALAVLASSVMSWVAYRGVERALETEFVRRVGGVAAATATQLAADDLAEAGLLGEESAGYGSLQLQLESMRAATGLENGAVFDSARTLLYDGRGPAYVGEHARLDSLVPGDVARALGGRPGVSATYRLGGVPHRAGLAPVTAPGGRVAGVVAVESQVDYLPVLAQFGRTLLLTWLLLTAAVLGFAALRIRQARRSEDLERELARAETLAAMGRLTATLAHEIKNPLAIIRGSAQRLGRLDPEAQRMADFVVEEADRLSRTVARYLQFARGGESARGAGDAQEALEATLALLEGEARARRVEIVREGAREPVPVPLDNESLKQIYLNLLLNAMEAMPEGGPISVACRLEPRRVEVAIADRGPGVPPELLKTLGTPFQTSKAQGSGLGLFLSRRLAQTAGGTLELANRPGGGATCTLRLPRISP